MRPNESYIIPAVTPPPSDPFPIRLGRWLFPRRTWIPIPLVAALLLLPAETSSPGWFWAGLALVAGGEWIRLAAVRQIGVISRTRSDRLGPLIATGPFARVRNPLYLGNIGLWVGIALSAGLPWLAPVMAALLLVEYHAIVRWEEQLLASRLGGEYAAYAARVPRWIPSASGLKGRRSTAGLQPTHGSEARFSWRETLFSERGTLLAVAAGYAILWAKAHA